jgi:hypothetical protein
MPGATATAERDASCQTIFIIFLERMAERAASPHLHFQG